MAYRLLRIVALSAIAASAPPQEKLLFDFEADSALKEWVPARLPDAIGDDPAPSIQIVAETAAAGRKGLKLTFDGGNWPVAATKKILVEGNWKEFATLKADLTVDKTLVAWFGVLQGRPDEKGNQARHQRSMILQPGRNEMTLLLHAGIGAMDPAKGEVTSFIVGAFRPEKGQVLFVENVRLSADWPPPKITGWYSPYNHDGYSSAVAREYQRLQASPKFKVLSTDLEVSDCSDLAKRLKDKWTLPEEKTIEQVENDFKAEFEKLRAVHPKAVLAILRDGEKGYDPANPDKGYAGWKFVYVNCHGPDGPNSGRENTPAQHETVEAFMRHRSPLLQADLTSIPKGSSILAARFVVTRRTAKPQKLNLWVAEPCNRNWDDGSANCYSYAPGKHWKTVSGLYYGEDPDFWPVFLMYGPAAGVVNVWDFTEGLKFWTEGAHENHGFFFYGDSADYMSMFTPRAKDPKVRPAMMVIYLPK